MVKSTLRGFEFSSRNTTISLFQSAAISYSSLPLRQFPPERNRCLGAWACDGNCGSLLREVNRLSATPAFGESYGESTIERVASRDTIDGLYLAAWIELPAISAVRSLSAHRDYYVSDAALLEDAHRLRRARRVRHLHASH